MCGSNAANWWTSVTTIMEHCTNTNALELSFAVTDVLTDILVLAIPIPIVWKLQISSANKFALTGIFLLGALSVKPRHMLNLSRPC